MIARAAVADDCAGVVACAQRFTPFTPTRANVEDLFAASLACKGMFVAEHHEQIIGFLCAVREGHRYTDVPCITVVAWWVPPAHRGTGAGLALLRVFLRWCSTQPVDLITISAPITSSLDTVLQAHGFVAAETLWLKLTGAP
jgi:GNAT superfamily N-acetyltransferase